MSAAKGVRTNPDGTSYVIDVEPVEAEGGHWCEACMSHTAVYVVLAISPPLELVPVLACSECKQTRPVDGAH